MITTFTIIAVYQAVDSASYGRAVNNTVLISANWCGRIICRNPLYN